MFGYININKEELKIKDFNRYEAYYCGLCQSLKKEAGTKGRMTISYDMTFLSMLLDSLFDYERDETPKYCPTHFHKRPSVTSEASDYAADMNILLTFDNLLDKWYDSKNMIALMGAKALQIRKKRIAEKYPVQAQAVVEYIEKLHIIEKEKNENLEEAAIATGEMLGVVFSEKEGAWKQELYNIGFYLGKFIYLADAYCDIEEDKRKKNYNPFLIYQEKHPETDMRAFSDKVLLMMISEATKAFERLPIVDNIEIMRNILYAGVWTKVVKANEDKKDNN